MRKLFSSFATFVALTVGCAGVALVLYAWRLPPFATTTEVTNDAYVRGQVTIIAPQLAGYIAAVDVQDYEEVAQGQVIAQIDDRIFQQKLAQARATLDAQRAALENAAQQRRAAEARVKAAEAAIASAQSASDTAQANFERVQPLARQGYVPGSDFDVATRTRDQAAAALDQAKASAEVSRQDLQTVIVQRQSLEAAVEGAEAAVKLAEIDLSNTRVVAPKAGRLGEVGVRLGQYVQAGTQLTSLVPNQVWVVANFKETQLPGMEVGQPVSFTVDALKGRRMTGRIERFAPATGSEFAVLRPDNATGNFTKVAQRVPVRIAIDAGQAGVEDLSPGLSVVVSIDTAAQGSTAAASTGTQQPPVDSASATP
ncbi:HlyD family secretion protein [Aureimonas jatrophae]|uniref:Multidrug resistance efflux pump n=1 Tax=Aureimonas jatrophae TaxID=1166073 RepID=A0A1H0LWD3_9HYPH|nr:HlyD family secretion protein [Aureimonas jatrophae]MBB3952776.1 multidrug resistance efflux pump [Aureimonas jatrophae]SDO72445.1 Multidrug resistance efflux pump [Aureimonas jatrophae]